MSMLNEVLYESQNKRDRSFKGRLKELVPWKGDDIREIVRKLVYIVSVGVLIYSLYGVVVYKFGTSDLHESKNDLSNLYYHEDPVDPPQNDPSSDNPAIIPGDATNTTEPDNQGNDNSTQPSVPDTPQDPEALKYPAGMLKRFRKLYDINPEIVGWLTIDGLADDNGGNYIDYPVMQTNDNDYYLSHDFYGTEKNYGALFVDHNIKVTKDSHPRNSVIYGHNMGAGTYFSHLHDYKKRVSFLSEHRLVTYSTLWEKNDYIIIGCFLIGIHEEQDTLPIFRYHLAFDFNTIEDFDYWYQNVLYRSYYNSDIPADMTDEYLTLSTCSNEFYESRFVVIARKLRPGEDASQYTYYSNPNPRKPAAFYEAYGMAIPKDDGPNYQYYGKDNSQTEGTEN